MAIAVLEEVVQPTKILVVEDDPDQRIIYQDLFYREPVQLYLAANLPEAYQYLGKFAPQFTPDVVISDFKIDEARIGNDFLRYIERAFPSCYRILASAQTRDNYDISNAQDFMVKFPSVKDFLNLVRPTYLPNRGY